MNNTINRKACIPPFIAFGTIEKACDLHSIFEAGHYDYATQKNIIPMFCGSDKKITKSAKNIGSFWFPEYKNVTDDAKEK